MRKTGSRTLQISLVVFLFFFSFFFSFFRAPAIFANEENNILFITDRGWTHISHRENISSLQPKSGVSDYLEIAIWWSIWPLMIHYASPCSQFLKRKPIRQRKFHKIRQPPAAVIKRKWRQKSRRFERLFWRYDVTSQMVPFSVTGHIFMFPQPKGRHTAFGADPISVGVGVGIAHCLHSISWTNKWILTKLTQTHYWEGGKKWLDFGDLNLIFKVTPAFWNFQILTKILFAPYFLNEMTDSGQTSYVVTLWWFKEFIIFWWPWPHFQGHHTIKTVKMSLVCTLISWTNW